MAEILVEIQKIIRLERFLDWLQDHLLFLIIAVVIIAFYKSIYRFLLRFFEKYILLSIPEASIQTFAKSVLKISLHLLLMYIIILLLGVNITSLVALLGAISVVLGFAFKEILSNILGGILLLIFKPFKVNDVIQINNYTGSVAKIEMFYTKIINAQNEMVLVPNGKLVSSEVKNFTVKNKRRLDLVIGVDYKSDIQQVKNILQDIVEQCEYVLKEEKITIGLGELAASSLNFVLYVYVRPSHYMSTKLYLLEEIKKRFDEVFISIPFNQLEVWVNPNEPLSLSEKKS